MNQTRSRLNTLNPKFIASFTLLVLCLAYAHPVVGQSDELTAEATMELFKSAAGKWIGTRTTDPNSDDAVTSRVTILNKMEADQWLYFQIAEKGDDGIRLSKGTLAFDPIKKQVVRRWFDSDSAEIKSAAVEIDSENKQMAFEWTTPGSGPEPDDGGLSDESEPSMVVRTEINVGDSDTRTVRVFSKVAGDANSTSELVSTMTLKRATRVATKNSTNGSASKTNQPKKAVAKKKSPPTKKASPKHTLVVKVYVASAMLDENQKPELVLTPADAKAERVDGNTFRFRGLKPGVEYTVKGNFQTEGALRIQTSGEASHEFSKSAKSNMVKTKILRLTGN